MLIDKSLKPNYYLITLLVIDPNDITKSKMVELDPMTVEAGVFMDKEMKIPAPISDPAHHLLPGERQILNANPEEGGFIKLDVDGYVPMKYMDRHCIALWFEFANVTEMLSNNDYDPVQHHGHLVMVRDYGDDPNVPNPIAPNMWAVYRLEGDNPHEIDSWRMIFFEAHFREYIKWEDIPDGPRSTVAAIDEMVSRSHPHFNRDVLDRLSVDEDGNLTFDGITFMLRTDFNAINILTKFPYNELLVGDIGHEVIYRGDYQPTSDTDSDGRTYMYGDISGYYEDNIEMETNPNNLNVSNAEKMNRFFKHCDSLTTINFMDIAFVEELDEFCFGCINLKNIATMSYHRAKTMVAAFFDCVSLKVMPPMDLTNCENVSSMFYDAGVERIGNITGSKIKYASELFANCKNLLELPKIDLSQVEDLHSLCKNCKSLSSVKLDTSSATDLSDAFYNCTGLQTLEIDMGSCTFADGIFDNCPELEYVIIHGDVNVNLDFSQTKLSIAAGTNIVDNLPLTNRHLSIILTNTPASKISSISVVRAERKGWTVIR